MSIFSNNSGSSSPTGGHRGVHYKTLTLVDHNFGKVTDGPLAGNDALFWTAQDEEGNKYSENQVFGRPDIDDWLIPNLLETFELQNITQMSKDSPKYKDCSGMKFNAKGTPSKCGRYVNYRIASKSNGGNKKLQKGQNSQASIAEMEAKYSKYTNPNAAPETSLPPF